MSQAIEESMIASTIDGLPKTIEIENTYTEDFISKIVGIFNLNPSKHNITEEIRYIGRSYIIAKRGTPFGKERQEVRKEYQARQRIIAKFRQNVMQWAEVEDVAGLMSDAARQLGEPIPQTCFPELTDHQQHRGDAAYHELLRLLRLAEKGFEIADQRLISKGGSPITNYGLEALTRKAADFWIDVLKRRFTVNQNQKCGGNKGQASDFVRMLAQKIEDIPNEKIITAIRMEKHRRAKLADYARKALKARPVPARATGSR